jgi:misacylated tRNA(Ala) deacylase
MAAGFEFYRTERRTRRKRNGMTEEIFRDDAYAKTCEATVVHVDAAGIRLDRTVFYPEGGGQPGDDGILKSADGRQVRIVDTRKGGDGAIVHVPAESQPALAVGDRVTAVIDWERRYKHMRMHSALHLLCAVVEGGVTGGSIGVDKSRLDFDLPDTQLDKDKIAADLNRLVAEDHPMGARWITDAELQANPELVRTMSVQPPQGTGRVRLMEIPGIDLQPCGGTHIKRTGEIGRLRVGKIENKGRHNRRINIHLDE